MATRLVKRAKTDPRKAAKDPLERLRENHPGQPMPVSFAGALSAWRDENKRNNRSRLARVRQAWLLAVEQIPGVSAAAARAEVHSVAKTGAVRVVVDNPTLAHELGVVHRKALLDKLRELLQGRDTVSTLDVRSHSQGRGAKRRQAPGRQGIV